MSNRTELEQLPRYIEDDRSLNVLSKWKIAGIRIAETEEAELFRKSVD